MKNVTLRYRALIAVLVVGGSIVPSWAQLLVEPVQWNSTTSGTLSGIAIDLSNISTPFGNNVTWFDANDSDFEAAPLLSGTEFVQYSMDSSWTVSFSESLNSLLLYAGYWRGDQTTDVDPATTYSFDRPFVILDGLGGALLSGNTLTLPDGSFHSGVLLFDGPLTSLSVIADNPLNVGHGQLLTFGVAVPEPAAGAVTFALACGLTMSYRLLAKRGRR